MNTFPLNKCPTIEGYDRASPDSRLVSEVDAGYAKIRNRYTGVPEFTTERYVLTKTELTTFKTWYEDSLNNGALQFSKEDPIFNTMRIYRFVDTPQVSAIGVLFQVIMPLQILPI